MTRRACPCSLRAMQRVIRSREPRRPFRRFMGIALLLLGCGAARATGPVPDFQLVDQNTNSVRHGQVVSPRDYIMQVSGYFFGNAE
jgi:hypothetical protein